MPQQIRRREAGRDQFGHHWENAGDTIEVSDSQASQLLAEPALPMYSLVTPGATVEAGVHEGAVGEGDPNAYDADSPQAQRERELASGSRPEDPRLKTPRDEGQAQQGGAPDAGKADTLDEPRESAAASDAEHARASRKPDLHEAPAEPAHEGRTVVGRSRTK